MSAAQTELQSQANYHAIATAAAKAAPPVAVSGATIAGVPVSDVVLWLTAAYLCIQIGYLGWKWYSEWSAKSKRRAKR